MSPDRTEAVMDLAKRRGFLWPAYEIYGGAAGFYDYGPLGAAMKKRFEDLWRRHFTQSAVPMVEISCPRVTPHEVLKASGHVDEFTDLVVKCDQGHPSRADHLVEGAGYQGTADALSADEIDSQIASLGAACPICKSKKFTNAAPQNLMNQTEIGPGSGRVGYLRPETAQGIFTDFPLLLRHQRGKLPFGVLQVGGSNRNEISPRQGMLRLREFNMMEAEVFFEDTSRPLAAFAAVQDEKATFVPNSDEVPVEMSFGEAVSSGMVANEPLAYFLAITQRFLLDAGINPAKLRFRQHLETEMAHYAQDCWDAEFHSERYGWVECVGVADRGCYDLTQHAVHSGKPQTHPVTGEQGVLPNPSFYQAVEFDEPITFTARRLTPVMGKLGRQFKGEAKAIASALEEQFLDAARQAGLSDAVWPLGLDLYRVSSDAKPAPAAEATTVSVNGSDVDVPAECFTVEEGTWSIAAKQEIPSVIEPSFGVDRILYALWEHAYEHGEKNGEPYTVMKVSPHVAPIQAAVLPLTNKEGLPELAQKIETDLRAAGIHTDFDTSGNIGRRYARQDEVGTPYCITVDPDSINDQAVTVRDRDTTQQERVPISEVAAYLTRHSED